MKNYNFPCEPIHWGLNIHLLGMEGGSKICRRSQLGSGRLERSALARDAQLLNFVKMMVFDRSYIWGQVTAITGDKECSQIILRDENDMKLT